MAKEAYLDGKRGLFRWQKRPIQMAKEAYLDGKRGLMPLGDLHDGINVQVGRIVCSEFAE